MPTLRPVGQHGLETCASVKDGGWGFVQYYVSEYVIRRTEDENKSPRDGTTVECRLPE